MSGSQKHDLIWGQCHCFGCYVCCVQHPSSLPHCAEVVKEVAVCGGTRCIAALLEAAPLVIKNEGVIALSLMATVQDSMSSVWSCVGVCGHTCKVHVCLSVVWACVGAGVMCVHVLLVNVMK